MNLEPGVGDLAWSAVQRQAGGRIARLYKLIESPRVPTVPVPGLRKPSKPTPAQIVFAGLLICAAALRRRVPSFRIDSAATAGDTDSAQGFPKKGVVLVAIS